MQDFMILHVLMWTILMVLINDTGGDFLGMGHAPCDGSVSNVMCRSKRLGLKTCVVEGAKWIREVKLEKIKADAGCNFDLGPPSSRPDKKGKKGLFGFYENAVWTNYGCKANILVCHSDFMCDASTKTITCRSKNNKQKSCDVGIGDKYTIVRVVLDRIMSKVACMYSPSPVLKDYKKGDPGLYGWTAKAVWVSRGCIARFKICYKEMMSGMMNGEMNGV